MVYSTLKKMELLKNVLGQIRQETATLSTDSYFVQQAMKFVDSQDNQLSLNEGLMGKITSRSMDDIIDKTSLNPDLMITVLNTTLKVYD
jgi:hypothetical protein